MANKFQRFKLIPAYIFSQYSNALTIFISFYIIDHFATSIVAVYALCISLYNLLNKLIYGMLTGIGTWGTYELKLGEKSAFNLYVVFGTLMVLIFGGALIVLLTHIDALPIKFIASKKILLEMARFYQGLAIGIIPNFFIMLLIQIYSSKNRGKIIVALRSAKLVVLPTVLFYTLANQHSTSMYDIGLGIGLGYLLILAVFMPAWLRLLLTSLASKKALLDKKNLLQCLRMVVNGLSYGLLVSSTLAYTFLVLFFLSHINKTVTAVYYTLYQYIALLSALPFAVSQAVVFTSAGNGKENLLSTLLYSYEIGKKLVVILLGVSVLFILFHASISQQMDTVRALNNSSLMTQYNLAYYLIPACLLLESIRYLLIAVLRGIKQNFLPMITNTLAFMLISFPVGALSYYLFDLPVIGFIVGELISLLLSIALLWYVIEISFKNSVSLDTTIHTVQ